LIRRIPDRYQKPLRELTLSSGTRPNCIRGPDVSLLKTRFGRIDGCSPPRMTCATMSPNGSNLASAGRVLSQRNVNASGIIIDGAFGKNSAKVRERGYVEGQNLSIDVRWPQGTFEHDPRPVAELINSNVDVIVAWPAPAVNAARRATSAIPIVMAAVGDPLGLGLVYRAREAISLASLPSRLISVPS